MEVSVTKRSEGDSSESFSAGALEDPGDRGGPLTHVQAALLQDQGGL